MNRTKEDIALAAESYHSTRPKLLIHIHGTADDNWITGTEAQDLPGFRHADPHTAISTWLNMYGLEHSSPFEHVYPDSRTVRDYTVAVAQTFADPVPRLGLAAASIFIVGGGHSYPTGDGAESETTRCKDIHASREIVRFWERYADLP